MPPSKVAVLPMRARSVERIPFLQVLGAQTAMAHRGLHTTEASQGAATSGVLLYHMLRLA